MILCIKLNKCKKISTFVNQQRFKEGRGKIAATCLKLDVSWYFLTAQTAAYLYYYPELRTCVWLLQIKIRGIRRGPD